jgi:hypothetical protein
MTETLSMAAAFRQSADFTHSASAPAGEYTST